MPESRPKKPKPTLADIRTKQIRFPSRKLDDWIMEVDFNDTNILDMNDIPNIPDRLKVSGRISREATLRAWELCAVAFAFEKAIGGGALSPLLKERYKPKDVYDRLASLYQTVGLATGVHQAKLLVKDLRQQVEEQAGKLLGGRAP
jgi:hypothetical protein